MPRPRARRRWSGYRQHDELLGGKARVDRAQFTGGDMPFQKAGDGSSRLQRPARAICERGREIAVLRRSPDDAMPTPPISAPRSACTPPAPATALAAPAPRDLPGRRGQPAVDHPPYDRLEQRLLAAKPMVESAFRDAGAFGNLLNAGRAEPVLEKQPGCDIENAVGEPRRLVARRSAALPTSARSLLRFRYSQHCRPKCNRATLTRRDKRNRSVFFFSPSP